MCDFPHVPTKIPQIPYLVGFVHSLHGWTFVCHVGIVGHKLSVLWLGDGDISLRKGLLFCLFCAIVFLHMPNLQIMVFDVLVGILATCFSTCSFDGLGFATKPLLFISGVTHHLLTTMYCQIVVMNLHWGLW